MASNPIDINKALAGKKFDLIFAAIVFAAVPFSVFICFLVLNYSLARKIGFPVNLPLLILGWPLLYPVLSLFLIPYFLVYGEAKKGKSALVDMDCPECKATPSIKNRRDFFRKVVEKTPCPICGKPYKFLYTWKFKILEIVFVCLFGVLATFFVYLYLKYTLMASIFVFIDKLP